MTTIKPNKSVGRARLMELGDCVEKWSKKPAWLKFWDYGTFVGFNDRPYGVNFDKALKKAKGPIVANYQTLTVNKGCGTSGCLLGHAPNVPSLAKLGVTAVLNDEGYMAIGIPALNMASDGAFSYIVLTNMLFGINGRRYSQIFTGARTPNGGKVTPMGAVKNLREVVVQIDKAEGWQF